MIRIPAVLARLLPDLGAVSAAERLRASVGAMLGLLVTGLVSRAALGSTENLPLLIAPMGASAVLLFAVPSSPLAQPWSILGGNVVAALIGVTAGRWIPDPITAAAVGAALAIAVMMVLRCLHPPSGAVALTAVLGGPVIRAAGYSFVIWPVGLNSVLLLAVALAFNNATGRRYPHRPALDTPAAAPEAAVNRVLRRHGEVVDVGPRDLANLLSQVEAELGETARCGSLMRPETDLLTADMAPDEALDRMMAARRTVLPVCTRDGHLVGLVSQSDLIRHMRPTRAGRRAARAFRRSLQPGLLPASIGEMAVPAAVRAGVDTDVPRLLEAMLASAVDYCPVVDADHRLLGAVGSADLLHWLAWTKGVTAPPRQPQPSSVIQRL